MEGNPTPLTPLPPLVAVGERRGSQGRWPAGHLELSPILLRSAQRDCPGLSLVRVAEAALDASPQLELGGRERQRRVPAAAWREEKVAGGFLGVAVFAVDREIADELGAGDTVSVTLVAGEASFRLSLGAETRHRLRALFSRDR